MKDETKQVVYQQLKDIIQSSISDDFSYAEFDDIEKPRVEVKTKKPVVIDGKAVDNVDFITVIIQKRHIGFYYSPVYFDEESKANLSERMAKMLKGKVCFHVTKQLSDEQQAEFTEMIQAGMGLYKTKEWI